MPIAVNPTDGSVAYLSDDGSWQPAKTAVNPQNRQMLAHDGKDWVPVPPKSKGVLSYIDDAVRSLANGATFGFADEIAAKANELVGNGTYDKNVAAERERNKEIPAGIAIPGEVAGAIGATVAAPVFGAVKGAGLVGRAIQSAKTGALFGGLSGAGEGEGAVDTAVKVGTGTVLGALLGSASTPVIEGIGQAAKYATTPIVNAWRGAVSPTDEAARKVVTALGHDARIDPQAANRLTPAEFSQNVQGGGPATIMDMGGETTKALARSAANTSPPGRQILNTAIDERFEGQTGRVNQWLNDSFNYPNARATSDALESVKKNVNRAAYRQAYTEGDKPLWSPELERLTGSDAVQAAIKGAVSSGKDRAIKEGYGGFRSPVTITQDGQLVFNKGPNGVPTYPNLQFWDATRREISDAADAAAKSGRKDAADRLGGIAKAINSELDSLVPSYQNARSGAAKFFGAEDALEAGQNFVTAKMANADAAKAMAQMSPAERKLFQDGFVSKYIDTLNATGDRRNILNKIAESPEARQKLEMTLGPQKAAELEARLRVEGIMDTARGATQGNSTTARQLAELGLAGGQVAGAGLLGHGSYNSDPKEMAVGAIIGALATGGKKIDSRVAEQVAKMLVSNDPQLVRRGITIVSKSGGMMDALRGADRRIAAAGAEQTPVSVPAFQSPGASRADEQQPSVPRPPGQ